MTLFLTALLYSIEHNRANREILTNITGGNIREVVDYVKKFMTCSALGGDMVNTLCGYADSVPERLDLKKVTGRTERKVSAFQFRAKS